MERGYDLVIFDGFLPPALPTNSTLLVAPPAGRSGPLRFAGALTAGAVNAASAGPLAGLLQYVDLGDVHVAQVRAVTLPGWMQPLATSNGHPVLAAGEEGTARFALVSFDLQHSDWPLRVSFPIMLQNLLQYLAPGLTLGQTTITTGQAVTFFPRPGTRALEVVRPDGGVPRGPAYTPCRRRAQGPRPPAGSIRRQLLPRATGARGWAGHASRRPGSARQDADRVGPD